MKIILLTMALLVGISTALPSSAETTAKLPPRTFTIAAPPTPPTDPDLRDRIEALRAAKRAGDRETARRLAALIAGTPEAAPLQPPLPGSPAPTIEIADAAGPGAAQKWGGDIIVDNGDLKAPTDEPSLAAFTDGPLLVAAVDADSLGITVFRSDDGGLSWSWTLRVKNVGKYSAPALATVDAPSRRFILAGVVDSGGPSSSVFTCWMDPDAGTLGVVDAMSAPWLELERPRLCVDAPEYDVWYPYLACIAQAVDGAVVWFTRSFDRGETWEAPRTLAAGLTLADQVDIDFGGQTLGVVHTRSGTDPDLHFIASRDFGSNWDPAMQLTGAGLDETDPKIALTTTGNILVSYTRRYGPENRDVESLWSLDGGLTWATSYLPYGPQDERYAAVAAASAGERFLGAFWREGAVWSTTIDLYGDQQWTPGVQVNTGTDAAERWPAIAALRTGDQEAAIAWRDDRYEREGVYYDSEASDLPPPVDYLVLCPDELLPQAERLAGYRRSRGLLSAAVPLSEVGPGPLTPAQVDGWLEDYWNVHPDLKYVTLAGVSQMLPAFELIDPGSGEPFHSDLRYASRESGWPEHYLPRLSVGRLPVSDPEQFDGVIDKIERFERSRDGRDRVVFFGSQPEMGYVATRDSATAASHGHPVTTLYSPDEAALMEALNAPDTGLVFYYGHGSVDQNWPLRIDNLDLLGNVDAPWLYFSGGCGFNDDETSVPLGHRLLLGPAGAAASAGAAVAGGYGYTYLYATEMLVTMSMLRTLGDAHRMALIYHEDIADNAGQDVGPGSWVYWFTERMQLIGDPALVITGDLTEAAPTPAMLLSQNRPNPFNAATTIAYELAAPGRVRLTIYDARGRRAAVLVDGVRDAGPHVETWDGRDGSGRSCASGVYFYRLESDGRDATRRMTLVK